VEFCCSRENCRVDGANEHRQNTVHFVGQLRKIIIVIIIIIIIIIVVVTVNGYLAGAYDYVRTGFLRSLCNTCNCD
jgi:t-SNARE complex subunit (syntaxin)